MNEISTTHDEQQILTPELSNLFAQLSAHDVERFYQGYQFWTIQNNIALLQTQIDALQLQIENNASFMQSVQPSPIALSVLAQLQANGVSDIDLLERMLERGEGWLDHTMQLLVRCEQLDVIYGDYTQWCENALEGAYDWIDSMDTASRVPVANESFDENIEATFLQKLMSEDETENKDLAVPLTTQETANIEAQPTAALPTEATIELSLPATTTEDPIDALSLTTAEDSSPVEGASDLLSRFLEETSLFAENAPDFSSTLEQPSLSAQDSPDSLPTIIEETSLFAENSSDLFSLVANQPDPEDTVAIVEDISLPAHTPDSFPLVVGEPSLLAAIPDPLSPTTEDMQAPNEVTPPYLSEPEASNTSSSAPDAVEATVTTIDDHIIPEDQAAPPTEVLASHPSQETEQTLNEAEQIISQESTFQMHDAGEQTPTSEQVSPAADLVPEPPADLSEPTPEAIIDDNTVMKVNIQEDEQALPPVTEPVENAKPVPQSTATPQNPVITWNETTQPPPRPSKKQRHLRKIFNRKKR